MKQNAGMRGISAPVLTPFHADGSINYSEYQRLLEYLVENGRITRSEHPNFCIPTFFFILASWAVFL